MPRSLEAITRAARMAFDNQICRAADSDQVDRLVAFESRRFPWAPRSACRSCREFRIREQFIGELVHTATLWSGRRVR